MLSRMKIEGFQAHDSLDVTFDPLITTIVGPSDVGKSSILRALRWCSLNKPRGDGFIRNGFKRMKVRIKMDDATVRRERGGNENVYALGSQEYRAFSNDVPPAIQQQLNLSDINFSSQHDMPFWFDLSPPEVARQLNKIVDLNLIDEVAVKIAQLIRSVRAEANVVEKRIAEAEAEFQSLSYVPEVDADLTVVEEQEEQHQKLSGRLRLLDELIEDLSSTEKAIEQGGCQVERASEVMGLGEKAQSIETRASRLVQLIDRIRETEQSSRTAVPDTSVLEQWLGTAEETENKIKSLEKLIAQVKSAVVDLEEETRSLGLARAEFEKELDGRCPVCGGKMTGTLDLA